MSQREAVYQWRKRIASQLPQLSKPQALVLAGFSLGMALARSCTLARVAEALASWGKPDTVERRLQRLLSNPRLDWSQGCRGLARWVLRSWASAEVVLLVDETYLQDKLRVMVVSLAYRGRALPLAWWAYPPGEWPLGQVELIRTLLGWVAEALPAGKRVWVQADRGIGTSPGLLEVIERLGWYYLVRVQGGVRLRWSQGGERKEARFAEVVGEQGQRWQGPVEAFKQAGWKRCWALGVWKAGQEQPWLLLSNDPSAQEGDYALRMWEELAFRDLKSNGWQWQRSRVWQPQHANRLWLVLALAYLWVLSLGTRVLRRGRLWRELSRGRGTRRSVFQLGLRYLKRWLALGKRLDYDLAFHPRKTVV